MSEPIPESIPTSTDKKSHRPTKRLALTPSSQQSSQLEVLFANPEKEIVTTPKERNGLAPPPEIVQNVQGSSAGAGSGEFHVYKASRRREYDRLRIMEEDVREEKAREEFERQREERRKKDEARTNKNRAKREKKKGKKGKDGKKDGERMNGVELGTGKESVVKAQPHGKENGNPDDTPGVAQDEVGLVIHDDDD
jgi:hypothetical protein